MPSRRTSGEGRRLLYTIVVIFFVLLVITLVFNRNGFMALAALREDIRDVSASIDSLEAQISDLEEEIELLTSDSLYQERMIREILGWGREDEFIVRFISPNQAGSSE